MKEIFFSLKTRFLLLAIVLLFFVGLLVSCDKRSSPPDNSAAIAAELRAAEEQRIAEIKRQQEEEKISRAMDSLMDLMRENARKCALNEHPLCNVEQISPNERVNEYQSSTRIEFYVIYDVRLKGSIFGVDKYEVGVKVRGRLGKEGDEWVGRFVDSSVEYDNERS